MGEGKTNAKRDGDESYYVLGAFLTGVAVFVGLWIYALSEWGVLLGLVFGWVPALIGGFVAGALWPLLVLVILFLLVSQ